MATLADILCDRRAGTTTKVEHRPTRRDERAKAIQPPAFVKAAFPQPRVDPSVSMPLIDVDNGAPSSQFFPGLLALTLS